MYLYTILFRRPDSNLKTGVDFRHLARVYTHIQWRVYRKKFAVNGVIVT